MSELIIKTQNGESILLKGEMILHEESKVVAIANGDEIIAYFPVDSIVYALKK